MKNAVQRAAGTMVGAVLVIAGVAACTSSDDTSGPSGAPVATATPSSTMTSMTPVVAFVRPVEGAGATVDYDDGSWACATRKKFLVVGPAVGADPQAAPAPEPAATAEAAALGQRDAAEVTIEQIAEQLDAPVEGSPDERVDLVAFAIREDGELIAVEVVEGAGTGWTRSSTTSCD